MLHRRQFEVCSSFLLLAALLYYLDTQNLLPWATTAAILHELGHLIAIRLVGGRVTRLRLTCVGAEITLSARFPLSPLQDLLVALAGPGINLLLALALARLATVGGESLYLFTGINLALAVFNLLPIAQLDGGRALRALLTLRHSGPTADRLFAVCSNSISLALVLGGGYLVLDGRASFTLLIAALWLACSSLMSVH